MRRITPLVFSLVSTFAVSNATAQTDSQPPCSAGDNANCEIKYDSSDWSDLRTFWEVVQQKGSQTGNNEGEDYVDDGQTLKVEDGVLKFNLQKVAENQYHSGKIISHQSITEYAPSHGYLEVEMTLPKIQKYDGRTDNLPKRVHGIWPAFWLLTTSKTWPTAGEIDLLETMQLAGQAEPDYQNADNFGFSTLHFGVVENGKSKDAIYTDNNGGNKWGYKQCSQENCYGDAGNYPMKDQITQTGFDTIGIEWQKIDDYWQVTQYVNGKVAWTRQFTRNNPQAKDINMFNFGRPSQNPSVDVTNRNFALGGLQASAFFQNGAGDPVAIFNDSLNKVSDQGFRIIFNLAFGGTPFTQGGRFPLFDPKLDAAQMQVHSVKLWNIKN